MAKQLFGQARKGEFAAADETGKKANPNKAIFPIVTQDEAGIFRFIGTGFFVAPMGIFVTAAHVVCDVLDSNGEPTGPFGIFHFYADNKYVVRRIVAATRHLQADVAVGRLEPLFDRSGQPLHNDFVQLASVAPEVGTPVHTFAFPLTEVDTSQPKQRIGFAPRYFSGEIASHYATGRDSVMLPFPCFETFMVLLGGASGGPVMTPEGKVFGVNSTGYEGSRLSFVSCISAVWDLGLDGIQLTGEAAARRVSLRELADRELMAKGTRAPRA